MNSTDLIRKVRKLEIKSRGLSNDLFAGRYHSAFRGQGMTFSEVREYSDGDDVRSIDWHVTARTRKPHVKIFEEERELTVMLLVDVSGSGEFGTRELTKRELMAEIGATLAFSAAENNDKVGCILFTDRVEKFIPPKKGRSHLLTIIRELVDFEPAHKGTSLAEPLQYLTNAIHKRCTAFVLSDFLAADLGATREALKIAVGRHDIMAVRLYDVRDGELANIGLVEMQDAETGRRVWVDTASRRIRREYAEGFARRTEAVETMLKTTATDSVSIATDGDYVAGLLKLFGRRK